MKKILFYIFLLGQICHAREQLIILNEGNWQSNNARISYFEDGKIVSNKWFEEKNGYGIGDTPNDIIQVKENLIAIAVNWSNIIQYISTDGTAVTATENVPNSRKMATNGQYLYITSYAHECETEKGLWTCERGFVAKINLSTFKVEKCCETGWEPEGVVYYNGYLFVANTGGYAFEEDHDYETTVSVIDASTMTIVKEIDTGVINLYGKMSQYGRYVCINSPGDYYEIPPKSIVLDCERALQSSRKCYYILDKPATYNCATRDGKFFAIGSSFSYLTYEYQFNTMTINPEKLFATDGKEGIDYTLPGTVAQDISTKFASPYGIYVNPYTGYIYATDANGDFNSPGRLYQWTPEGVYVDNYKIYINPAHFLALGNWVPVGMKRFRQDTFVPADGAYTPDGLPVRKGYRGIVVYNKRKFIQK